MQQAPWLLAHPLENLSRDPHSLDPYRQTHEQPDGSLLVVVLAVDR